jgi:hypothetical protein
MKCSGLEKGLEKNRKCSVVERDFETSLEAR